MRERREMKKNADRAAEITGDADGISERKMKRKMRTSSSSPPQVGKTTTTKLSIRAPTIIVNKKEITTTIGANKSTIEHNMHIRM